MGFFDGVKAAAKIIGQAHSVATGTAPSMDAAAGQSHQNDESA
jgi:hypothetical protein